MNTLTFLNEFFTSTTVDDHPTNYTRFFGGSYRNVNPFVTGFYATYIKFPKYIFDEDNRLNCERFFSKSITEVTIPSKTITTDSVKAFNGIKKNIILGQELSNNITVNFIDVDRLINYRAIKYWIDNVNAHTGQIFKQTYKSRGWFFLLKPNFQDDGTIKESNVEDIHYFEGIFPTECSGEVYSSEIASPSFSVTFLIDVYQKNKFHEEILNEGLTLINENGDIKTPADNFLKVIKGE